LPLALFKPDFAFFAGIILITGSNVHYFNATRLELFGPYLNLNDACDLVVIVALLAKVYQNSEDLKIPLPMMLLITVVGIGAFQSF
jgi:hypothetical protein